MSEPNMTTLDVAHKQLAPNGKDNHAFAQVRVAQADEEDDIYRLCIELHKENGNKYFSLSEYKVRKNLERAFTGKLAMVPCIGPKRRIEALGYVSIEQFAWSDDWHISEWFNYVLPERRQSRNARTLLEWERGASESLKLLLWIGVTSEEKLAAKLRLYRRVFGNDLIKLGYNLKKDMPSGFDIDRYLLSCGVSGCYFVYKPKSLYSA